MRIVAEDTDRLAVVGEGEDLSVTRAVRTGRTCNEESHVSLDTTCHPGSCRVGIGLIPDRNGKGGTVASVRAGHPDYCAAGGRSLWSISACSALRNESSVSIVFVNPAWRSLTVLTKARGP